MPQLGQSLLGLMQTGSEPAVQCHNFFIPHPLLEISAVQGPLLVLISHGTGG